METLDSLRKKIETTDRKITKLLKKRYALVKKIGAIKRKQKISVIHKDRENQLLLKTKLYCKGSKEIFKYISNIFKHIYKESHKIQKKD
ncbi:chorismate mutase [Patescibacteria group bacterium]